MRSKFALLFVLFAGLSLLGLAAAPRRTTLLPDGAGRPQAGAGARQPGQGAELDGPPAPDFSLTRFSDDRKVSLADVRGKVALVFFFFPT